MATNSFTKALPKTPTSIGNVTITLNHDGANKSANYLVEVKDQDGSIMRVPADVGDLVPHLSQADITWLLDFMGRMRAKAAAEFL